MSKAPPPVPGVFLALTPDDPEQARQADDIRDLVAAEVQGRATDTDQPTQNEIEEERRAEAHFFEVVATHLHTHLTWAHGKARVIELGTRDGYHITLRDREGRPYEVQIYYSDLAEIALQQREHDRELGPERCAAHIADKLNQARKRYFERMIS